MKPPTAAGVGGATAPATPPVSPVYGQPVPAKQRPPAAVVAPGQSVPIEALRTTRRPFLSAWRERDCGA